MSDTRWQIKQWTLYPDRYLIIDTFSRVKSTFSDRFDRSAFLKYHAEYIAFHLNRGTYRNDGLDFLPRE